MAKIKEKSQGARNLDKYMESLSPEERKAHYDRVKLKVKESRERKRLALEEARVRAKELFPVLLAEELVLAQDKKSKPPAHILAKLRGLLDSGLTIDQLRKQYFSGVKPEVWKNVTAYLFEDHVGSSQDMGLQLLEAKRNAVGMLDKRIREYRKEIRVIKRHNKLHKLDEKKQLIIPWGLRDRLAKAEDQKIELELDMAKTLHQVGAVGDKKLSAGGGITLNVNVPRPPPTERDVTPVTLDALVSKGKVVGDGD